MSVKEMGGTVCDFLINITGLSVFFSLSPPSFLAFSQESLLFFYTTCDGHCWIGFMLHIQ